MKHQSGRSMVEILGVLAIIGLLSVGGLTAYNYAMDKKVVNDLMYDMELATTEIWTSGTTGPGGLNEKMDVSVLGENHPNITVRKLQHMENGEIVLDERDGEITEEDVAAVENGEQPAFSIEIHDITVAQCVQLLRNQDKLNTPFLLEDSDGNVFDPENGDDPQDFCERIFGGDDPVAFGLISNAYAKQSNTFVKKVLSIFYPETPEEKWQRELEDCAKQPKNKSSYIEKGRLCGFPDDCDCYNPAKGYYFMKVGKECVKASVSKSGTSMFSSCVGSEEDRERAIEYIKKTKVKELTGMELVFKGVWFGPDDYDNPNSLSGFHAEYVFARVPCIIKDADGEKLVDYVSTRCLAFDPIKGTVYGNYQGCCPSGYVAQVGNSTLDNKITLMDGKFAECTSNSHCADKGEGKKYCDTLAPEPRCVSCPEGTEPKARNSVSPYEYIIYDFNGLVLPEDKRGMPQTWCVRPRCRVDQGSFVGIDEDGKEVSICCDKQNGNLKCACTPEYFALSRNKEGADCSDYDSCENGRWTSKAVREHFTLTQGMGTDWAFVEFNKDGELVWVGGSGTCTLYDGTHTVCEVGMGNRCPCFDYKREDGENLNENGSCNYCPVGTYVAMKECIPCPLKHRWTGEDKDGFAIKDYGIEVCEQCPSDKPFATPDKKGCMKNPCAHVSKPFYNEETNECYGCLDVFPDGRAPVADIEKNLCTTCVDKYGTDEPYWDKEAKQCKPCPSDKPKWNGSSCQSCPAQTPVLDGDECVTCYQYRAETPYWNDDLKQCEKCPEGKVWDNEQKTCVTKGPCPDGYNWNGNCCWDRYMNEGMGDCVCDCGDGIWDGPCCGSANDNAV